VIPPLTAEDVPAEAARLRAGLAGTPPFAPIASLLVELDVRTGFLGCFTHAIRMAACNAETTLARALDGHYARAGDEAYALIREALTVSGDIIPGHGELLIRLDPLTAPRRTQALAALCDQLNQAPSRYPGTDLVLRYEVKPHPGIA
jgi:Transposase protein